MGSKDPIQNVNQKTLAAKKAELAALRDTLPAGRRRSGIQLKINDIDLESRVEGWLSSKDLRPPR